MNFKMKKNKEWMVRTDLRVDQPFKVVACLKIEKEGGGVKGTRNCDGAHLKEKVAKVPNFILWFS